MEKNHLGKDGTDNIRGSYSVAECHRLENINWGECSITFHKSDNERKETTSNMIISNHTNLSKENIRDERIKLLYTYWNQWIENIRWMRHHSHSKFKKKRSNNIVSIIEKNLKQYNFFKKPNSFNNENMICGVTQCNKININKKKNNYSVGGAIYDKRYIAQQEIIAKQKKIIQQQKIMIEKVQMEKFYIESDNISKEKMRNKISRESKKINFCKSEPYTDKQLKKKEKLAAFKTPSVLLRMQAREQNQKIRWEALREKKLQLEKQKKEVEMEEEERKRQTRKNDKKLKDIEQKNNLLRRRIAEENKIRAKRRELELNKWASKFLDITLITIALKMWKCFLTKKKEQITMVQNNCQRKQLKKYFNFWKSHTNEKVNERYLKTKVCLENYMKAKYFLAICSTYQYEKEKIYKAKSWHNKMLKMSYLKLWMIHVNARQLRAENLLLLANKLYRRNLMNKCFRQWVKFPSVIHKEREKEQRMRIWKDKITEILPDFNLIIEFDK